MTAANTITTAPTRRPTDIASTKLSLAACTNASASRAERRRDLLRAAERRLGDRLLRSRQTEHAR